MLFKSHISNLAAEAFLFIIIVSASTGFLYVNHLQKRFNKMIHVLERFQGGDTAARLHVSEKDEMGLVAKSFNSMADQLVYNINRLTTSEQERKNLIVNISHDLRTPLSVARGYTETLLISKDISADEQAEYIKLIIAKIQQVENMVRKLFDLSKMESAAFEVYREPFIFSHISFGLMALTQKGDTIAVESPVYFGILQLAKSLGLKVIELPTHPVTGIEPNAQKNSSQNKSVHSGF
jgi:signal transduction histidine kinase